MTDIHCHILPDIDDGASGMEESLEMARMALDSGVTDVIATPHFRGEEESLSQLPRFERRYNQFRAAMKEARIPLNLHLGAEILCLPQTPDLAKEKKLPTLGDTDYVLIEFFFDETFAYMDESLQRIAACGYRIVVAHPERYGVIQDNPVLLEKWVRDGYVLQMNKGSVLGMFGSRTKHAAHAILEMGLAHLFASDGHSATQRTPHMRKLTHWVESHCIREYADVLLKRNPRRVLKGRPMVEPDI